MPKKQHETNIPDDIDGLRFSALSKKAKINYVVNIVFLIVAVVGLFLLGYWIGGGNFPVY
jgi:hypothetical protein